MALVAGFLVSLVTFVLFYLMTVFALSWGTNALGYSRAGEISAHSVVRHLLLRTVHSCLRSAGGTGTPPGNAWGDRIDRYLRPVASPLCLLPEPPVR